MSTTTTRTASRNARLALAGAAFGNPGKAAAVMRALPRMEQPNQQSDQPSTEAGQIAALESRVASLEQRVDRLEKDAAPAPDQAATSSSQPVAQIDTAAIYAKMSGRAAPPGPFVAKAIDTSAIYARMKAEAGRRRIDARSSPRPAGSRS